MYSVLIILFLLGALVILYGGHWVLYYTFTRVFDVTGPGRYIIGVALFLLATSFLISSFFAHLQENLFTRVFYFISSLWLGIVTNLFISIVLCVLVFWLFKLVGTNLSLPMLGIAGLALAGVISIYGVWNAYHPVVKEITVNIKNLPPEWRSKKAVQISDIHLGHIFRSEFLKEQVVKINELNPDIVFITGDLFDGMDGRSISSVNELNNIKAPLGIYFVTGNHDTYFGLDKINKMLSTTNVKMLYNKLENIQGLQVIGVNYPESGEKQKSLEEVISGMPSYQAGKPSILLYHSPVYGIMQQAKEMGISLQLSGHTHRGQIFPYNFITAIIYHRLDYGLHQMGDYTLYTTSGLGAWGPTMRTGNKPEMVLIHFQ